MNKADLRLKFKLLRKNLSHSRRLQAQNALMNELYPALQIFSKILSFASFNDEIDLWPFNKRLAKEGRLYLPKMEHQQICAYQVLHTENHLVKSVHGPLEPYPKYCKKIAKKNLDCVLVPGLCFDQNNNRLGYGLGHFDRFLKDLLPISTYGIGFKEQRVSKLPIEPHDISLTKVYLF